MITMANLFDGCEYWQGKTKPSESMFDLSASKDLNAEVEKIFRFYRAGGYPSYSCTDYNIRKEYDKLKKFNEMSIFDGKNIKQSMTGLGVLWVYHPHWIEVVCANEKQSLKELWENDDKLRELIRKTYLWKLKHGEMRWTHNRIRQNAKVFMAKQSVSNFRPTVAKLIYNIYGNNGDVLDMSAGFSGRLFGFFASNCNSYTGIEPSEKTYQGLLKMAKDLQEIDAFGLFPRSRSVNVYKTGSEIYNPAWDKTFDLCFTSPPYFDTERYSDECTQSYKKYPTLQLWLNGFLKQTIDNCWKYTKPLGYTIINIADTPKYKGLEKSTVDFAKQSGFAHVDTLNMEMSAISKTEGRKTEPIFIFKKEEQK